MLASLQAQQIPRQSSTKAQRERESELKLNWEKALRICCILTRRRGRRRAAVRQVSEPARHSPRSAADAAAAAAAAAVAVAAAADAVAPPPAPVGRHHGHSWAARWLRCWDARHSVWAAAAVD